MRRWLCASALAVALVTPGTTGASAAPAVAPPAGLTAATTSTCPTQPLSQPLAPFGDQGWYYLVRNGSFTNGTDGWTTNGTTGVTWSSPSPDATHAGGGALYLGPWSGARSAAFCTDDAHDRTRFFYRGQPGSSLLVKVTSRSNLWYSSSFTINYRLDMSDDQWHLSPTIAVPDWTDASGIQSTTISFETSGGPAVVDDVLVDPWRYQTT